MGDDSAISWTDATWNCVRGCSQVSPELPYLDGKQHAEFPRKQDS